MKPLRAAPRRAIGAVQTPGPYRIGACRLGKDCVQIPITIKSRQGAFLAMGAAVDDPDFLRLAQGAPHLSYEEIVRHPRMAEARKLYVSRFLALYDRDPFMARLLIETGRFLVYHVAVILGAAQDPALRETWLTVGRLKKAVAMFGAATDRHMDQIVGRLRAVGFLASHPAEQDRRIRILMPTEKMLAHDRAWLAAHYAPLTAVSRFDDYQPVMGEDPAYQRDNRRVAVEFLPFSGKLLAVAPELLLFFKHAGGHMVSASLLHAAMASPDAHAAVPYGEIGDRFGISRTHVRTILSEAQDAGLVRPTGAAGTACRCCRLS
jgi:hypothetical protein